MLKIVMMLLLVIVSLYGTSTPTISASDGTYTDKVTITSDTTPPAGFHAEIFRAISENAEKSKLGVTTTDHFNDTTAVAGTVYYYFVKVCNDTECSGYSTSDIGYKKLSTPSNLWASELYSDRIEIKDYAVDGATGYNIYRAETENGDKTYLDTTSSVHHYDDFTALATIDYYYYVKAYAFSNNSYNYSEYSTYVIGHKCLTPPTAVASSDGTYEDKVVVSFNSVPMADYYEIRRYDSIDDRYIQIGTTYTLSFDDTSAIPGTIYNYAVLAASTNPSEFSGITTDDGYRALSKPTNIMATDGTHEDKVVISNYTVEGATSYYIYRADSETGNQNLIATVASESFDDECLTPGMTYYYFVQACKGTICSDISEYDTGYASNNHQNLNPAIIMYLLD